MKRIRGFLPAILVFLASTAHGNDPVQYWPEANVTAKLTGRLKAQLGIQSRLDEGGALIQEYSDIGIAYTGQRHWLDVGLNYRVTFKRLLDDVWSYESRPHLNATARFTVLDLAFSNRIRLEYNDFENLSGFGTARNKLSLNPPLYLEPTRERLMGGYHKVRPFASYEFFFSTQDDRVNRHRFQAGVSSLFGERTVVDIYYLRQETEIDSTWLGLNVAGLKLKLLF